MLNADVREDCSAGLTPRSKCTHIINRVNWNSNWWRISEHVQCWGVWGYQVNRQAAPFTGRWIRAKLINQKLIPPWLVLTHLTHTHTQLPPLLPDNPGVEIDSWGECQVQTKDTWAPAYSQYQLSTTHSCQIHATRPIWETYLTRNNRQVMADRALLTKINSCKNKCFRFG